MDEVENRTRLDPETYGRRTMWTNIGLFQFGFEWKNAGLSIFQALCTTFFPAVFYSVIVNCVLYTATTGATQLTSFALVAAG